MERFSLQKAYVKCFRKVIVADALAKYCGGRSGKIIVANVFQEKDYYLAINTVLDNKFMKRIASEAISALMPIKLCTVTENVRLVQGTDTRKVFLRLRGHNLDESHCKCNLVHLINEVVFTEWCKTGSFDDNNTYHFLRQ